MAVVEMRKVILKGTETKKSLRARGLPETTARRALKCGYYYEGKHLKGGIRKIPEGPGHFDEIRDPYSFARLWVVKALRRMSAVNWHWSNLEDYIQMALMELWEKRHYKVEVFPPYGVKVMLRKVKDVISGEMRRVDRELEYQIEMSDPDWDAIRMPMQGWHSDVRITRYSLDGTITTTIHKVTQKEDAA